MGRLLGQQGQGDELGEVGVLHAPLLVGDGRGGEMGKGGRGRVGGGAVRSERAHRAGGGWRGGAGRRGKVCVLWLWAGVCACVQRSRGGGRGVAESGHGSGYWGWARKFVFGLGRVWGGWDVEGSIGDVGV